MKKERCRKNQLLSLFLSTILAVIFVGCRSFTSEYISYEDINPDFVMHLDRAWVLDKYIGDADVVVVPERVERIGEAAFCGKSMSEVVLPEGIVDIGEAAFEYCTNLKIVDFPSTVRTIGKRAFFRCDSLRKVDLPEEIISIGTEAFARSGAYDIYIPSAIFEIGQNAFYDCAYALDDWGDFEGSIIPDELHRWPVCNGIYLDHLVSEDTLIPNGVKKIVSIDYPGLERIILPPTIQNLDSFNFNYGEIKTIYGLAGSETEALAEKYECAFVPLALDKERITLKVGETDTLTFNCPCVREWNSSNEQVVTVSEGRVSTLTALAPGKTTVSAEIYGETFTCEVTVTE